MLLNEVQAMQNPALGATLLWRFACGYSERGSTKGTPLPLLFVVLPVVLHFRTVDQLIGTQLGSGLRKFEEKFKERSDMLLLLQPRMLAMRKLSLRSLHIALASGLVTLVTDDATVWPRSYTKPSEVPKALDGMMKSAEKLGNWCEQLTLFEISGTLRVEL